MWLPPSRAGKMAFCGSECRTVNWSRRKENHKGWHEARFIEDRRKVPVKCLECEKPMWLPRSKVNEYLRCGPQCNALWRARTKDGLRRFCETCGTSFLARTVQIAMGHGRFCSQACNTVGRKALASAGSQLKASARMRQMRAEGLITSLRGPDNPLWTGGTKASSKRRIENGKAAECIREYRRKNPHKVREWHVNRKERKLGKLPRGTILRIGLAQRWKCAICAIGIRRLFHADHIMPLSRGGLHKGSNMQLLCVTCNLRKNAKDPIDYMQSLGRLI